MAKKRYKKNEWNIDDPEDMERAKQWLQRLLNQVDEGAEWGIPRSFAVYKIFHSTKTVIRLSDPAKDASTEKVFKALGWKVVKPTKES